MPIERHEAGVDRLGHLLPGVVNQPAHVFDQLACSGGLLGKVAGQGLWGWLDGGLKGARHSEAKRRRMPTGIALSRRGGREGEQRRGDAEGEAIIRGGNTGHDGHGTRRGK